MRPRLDRVLRQFLPVFILGTSVSLAAEEPVANELNSMVEEPLINLPEVDSTSPFRSASRRRSMDASAQQDDLIQLAEEAVDSTRRRLLSTEINSPWQMMHGLLALRRDFEVRKDGEIVKGLDWISSGPTYEGEPWFEKTPYGGRAHPYSRPWAFEGHANQFLAILSMSALPVDHQFQTNNGPITIAQMVEHAQKAISSKDEPTWTLWALSRYLPPDATWRNTSGENWSIERLVSIQSQKPLKGSACGGTHGMFALAHARNVYLRSGKPLRGVWLEAEYKIRRQINTVRVQQNSNGMLSSNYFRGREYKQDFNKRMASAGHLLEFLMISLPQDELQERWVRRAIRATAQDLIRNRKSEVRCSPLYHAVNGLNIYLDRVRPQETQVASNADADDQLQPVDEAKSGSLKSVPATSISESKPVMEDKPSTPAADSPEDKLTGDDSESVAAATANSSEADEAKEPTEPQAPKAGETPVIAPAPSVASTPTEDKGWRKASRASKDDASKEEKEAADTSDDASAGEEADTDSTSEEKAEAAAPSEDGGEPEAEASEEIAEEDSDDDAQAEQDEADQESDS